MDAWGEICLILHEYQSKRGPSTCKERGSRNQARSALSTPDFESDVPTPHTPPTNTTTTSLNQELQNIDQYV